MIESAFNSLNSKGTLIIIGNSKLSSKIKINPFDFIGEKKLYVHMVVILTQIKILKNFIILLKKIK